jgi:poly-gamma-glutamate synthesis protein (capsule biosynthesis protein)
MTGRGIDQVLQQASAPALFESSVRDARDYVALAERLNGPIPRGADAEYIWGEALAEIRRQGRQLCVVNLETAITTSADPWPGKGVHYRMHPANVGCLTAAAIDCCALANNHVLDWGRKGLEETLHTLHAAGVRTAGAGIDGNAAWAPAAFPVGDGRRLLVFACAVESSGVPAGWAAAPRRPGIALLPDLSDATARHLADDAAGQRRGDGLVIVSIHWGSNWGEQVPAQHRRFAHRLIDLGAADIVHGHSSHHPLPIEVYRGRLILYGCGDLINDYEGIASHGQLRSDVGCLYFATLDAVKGTLRRLKIVPMQLRRFRLQHADAAARQWVANLFNSAELGTQVVPQQDGSLAAQWGRVHEPAT